MPSLFKTVFLFEWAQLLRQKALVLSLVFFIVLEAFSIYSGNTVISNQLTVIDSLHLSYQRDVQASLKELNDTASEKGKAKAKMAGHPALVNFRLPQNAVNFPKAMAALSIGQRDVNPYYYRVKSNITFLDDSNNEISNPALLFEGNFDLAFVITFLLPLLIIAFCYNLVSVEQETGTFPLLVLQSNLHRIVVCKLIFRLIIIAVPVALVNIAGMLLSNGEAASFQDGLLWMFVIISYILFWFTLCYAVVMRKRNSAGNALSLVGIWLLFVIILPALANIYVSITQPVPLRAGLASYERHIGEQIWETSPRILIDSFHRNNPQYRFTYNPVADTLNGSIRFFAAYHDLKERRVLEREANLNEDIQKGNDLTEKLSFFSPAVKIQHLLNTIAGTGLQNFAFYKKQVDTFQKKWKHRIYTAELSGTNFTATDLKMFPEFKMERYSADVAGIITGSLIFWTMIILCTLSGLYYSKR